MIIPELKQKAISVKTTALHTFVLGKSRLSLRLLILDHSGHPRAAEPCALAIEDDSGDLVTDGNGKIERSLAPSVQHASVTFSQGDAPVEIPIDVGHLDPVDVLSGWQARLINLGYLDSPVDDENDPEVRSAVEEFQCDNALTVSGQCDEATQRKILTIHGI